MLHRWKRWDLGLKWQGTQEGQMGSQVTNVGQQSKSNQRTTFGQGGGGMQMHFFCIFLHIQEPLVFCIFCIFFAFFCICFAFGFLLMSQSMDKFVSRGVANDAAADVDDTPELTDGEGDSEPDLEEPEEPEKKKVKLNYGAKTKYAHV